MQGQLFTQDARHRAVRDTARDQALEPAALAPSRPAWIKDVTVPVNRRCSGLLLASVGCSLALDAAARRLLATVLH